MTPAGWIFMISALGSMTLLTGWCIFRVLRTPESAEHLHSPADIETHDT
jgi:hypothetical protein